MTKTETLRERKELLSILCEAVETLERSPPYLFRASRPPGAPPPRPARAGPFLSPASVPPPLKDIWASIDVKYEELSPDNKARYDAYTTAINLISKLG